MTKHGQTIDMIVTYTINITSAINSECVLLSRYVSYCLQSAAQSMLHILLNTDHVVSHIVPVGLLLLPERYGVCHLKITH